MKQFQHLKYKDWVFIVYLLILQMFLFYWMFIYEKDIYLLLYFCYHAPIITIFILMFKKEYLPIIINVGLFGQVLYLFDFSIAMLLQDSFLNYYEYYLQTPIATKILVLIAHLTTLLLIISYRNIPIIKKHFLLSWTYFIIVYTLSLLYMPTGYNVNAIETTYTIIDNLPYFTQLYLFNVLWVVIIPTYLIQIAIYKISTKTKKKNN